MLSFCIYAFKAFARIVYFFMKLFPTQKKVTLISRQSDVPSQDFTLLETCLKQKLQNYSVVVKSKHVNDSVTDIIKYLPYMLVQMFHISTSELVIIDSYCLPVSILNHKKCLMVFQIWHALGLMKKAGNASIGLYEGRDSNLSTQLHMHRGYTHILVSSMRCKRPMLDVFGYEESENARSDSCIPEIVVGALPRTDLLLSSDYSRKVRNRFYKVYPELLNRQIVLYAPTSRKDSTLLENKMNELVEAVDRVNKNGASISLLIKFHPLQNENRSCDYAKNVLLMNEEFSSVELAMVSEACISDYSSIIYEFIILEKPVYFYAFDLECYKNERGLFIDYENEIPGELFSEADELIGSVVNRNYSLKHQKDFLQKYVNLRGGNNTGYLVQIISDALSAPKTS